MVPECLQCGTCCFSGLSAYVRVTGDDYERLAELGDEALDLVWFEANRAFMRMTDGHCAALLIDADGSFACRIYAHRPSTCRELERGSPSCLGERDTKSERPLVALRIARST